MRIWEPYHTLGKKAIAPIGAREGEGIVRSMVPQVPGVAPRTYSITPHSEAQYAEVP